MVARNPLVLVNGVPAELPSGDTVNGASGGGGEPVITPGTSGDYWRGDKTWQPLNKAAVGLSSADDTADSAKPVSTAQAAAIALKIDLTQKAAANGVASLDSGGKVPTSQLPALAITSTFVVNSQAAQLALTVQEGDVAVRTDLNKTYIQNGGSAGTMADWQEMLTPTDAVISVNGMTGAVTVSTITGNANTATALATVRTFELTGGVTASPLGFNGASNISLVATVDAGHITLARMANVATGTVFYRKTAGTGAPEVQTLATLKTDLGLTGAYTGSPFTLATARLLGRTTAGTGAAEEISVGTGLTLAGGVLSATGAPVGPARVSGNYYSLCNTQGASVSTSVTLGTIHLTPFILDSPMTVSELAYRQTSGVAGNISLALYASSATTGMPTGSALGSTASTAVASGVNSVALTANVTLAANTLYYHAKNTSSSTPFLLGYDAGATASFASFYVGSGTLADILTPAVIRGWSVTQAFGTWPSLTSASFTATTLGYVIVGRAA